MSIYTTGDGSQFTRYGFTYQRADVYLSTSQPGQYNTASGLLALTKDFSVNAELTPQGYASDPLADLVRRVNQLENTVTNLNNEIFALKATTSGEITTAHKQRDEMYALVEDLKDLNGRQ